VERRLLLAGLAGNAWIMADGTQLGGIIEIVAHGLLLACCVARVDGSLCLRLL